MRTTPDSGPPMWVTGMAVFLNHWFAEYDQARAHIEAVGGYLLPHGTQYFVTEAGAIEELGLDPADPDWARIGHDWARPADPAAFARLQEQRELAP